MLRFFSIFLIGFVFQIFIFEPAVLSASTFKLGSIVVEGNNRISDEAVVNYTRLSPNTDLSSEELNTAYKKVLDTGLFKNVAFKQDSQELIITVEEYPTVNEISFEGNKKFTDEKLTSFLATKPNLVFTPVSLEKDLAALHAVYKNSGRYSARVQSKVINLSNNRVNLIYEIYEGGVIEIEKINFVGNREFSNRRLRRVLSSKQAGLLRKIILRDTLIEEKISEKGLTLTLGKANLVSFFFSIFSSLNLRFSSCLCLLFILQEVNSLSYFSPKKFLIKTNFSLIEEVSVEFSISTGLRALTGIVFFLATILAEGKSF